MWLRFALALLFIGLLAIQFSAGVREGALPPVERIDP